MTTRKHKTKLSAVEEAAGDRDLMKALMKEALQEVLEGERPNFPGAAPGERTEGRNGSRAGYYGRNPVTCIGKLELRVPRERNDKFSTTLFELYWERENPGGGAGGESGAGQGAATQRHVNIAKRRNTAARPIRPSPKGCGWKGRLRRCRACPGEGLHPPPCIHPFPATTPSAG